MHYKCSIAICYLEAQSVSCDNSALVTGSRTRRETFWAHIHLPKVMDYPE